jgi:hypothetical protein
LGTWTEHIGNTKNLGKSEWWRIKLLSHF